MNYKLIFVEGLPGTGKTTLAKRIFSLLSEQKIQAELLLEDDERNPCNFDYIAGIPKSEYLKFSFDKSFIIETKNFVYINVNNCTEEIKNQIQCYDIGNEYNKFISVQEYARCTLEWWRYWTANKVDDSILILDSAFLQCPINEMIFRGASDSEIKTYIQEIAKIIQLHNPICVYLRRKNAEESINFAKTNKGEGWAKRVDEKLIELGCPDLFERRFILENTLLTTIPNIICYINDKDWSIQK